MASPSQYSIAYSGAKNDTRLQMHWCKQSGEMIDWMVKVVKGISSNHSSYGHPMIHPVSEKDMISVRTYFDDIGFMKNPRSREETPV
jgi:hypothetical protein